jgi:LacI family transcriptional regulator
MVAQNKRIAIVVELAVGYREAVVRGLWRFLQTRPLWEHQGCELHVGELNALRNWKPDGIVAGLYDINLGRALKRLNAPIVDVYNCVELTGVVQVGIDDVAVGDMAAKYLLSLGLKNLALVGDYSTRYALERRDAFLRILHAEDLKCYQWDPTEKHRPPVEHLRRGGTSASSPGSHTFSATAWSSSFRRQWGDAVSQWITDLPKPVGIFALNDDWATMIVDQCNHQSIAVPEQVAILGVDNAELLCQMGRPPLSSIETPAEKVGWEAGVALEKLMEGKPVSSRQLLQPVRVVERQSTNILAIDDPDVTAAIRFIQANVHRGIGVREVLMTVPSRRRTLEMSFRKSVGRSILDEIQRLRVERAKMLLSSTDLKLSVVAQRSGFRSASRLCRMFRQVSGETPAHFRRRRELA